ncbi:MAG: amidohydrolase family protein, partial [Novosphingobium sp.]
MNRLLIRNCRIFDGHTILNDGRHLTIAIADGRIERVGPIDDAEDRAVIDAEGRTAMPGLIDAHFHACSPTLSVPTADGMPDSLLAQHARAILEGALLRGFTSVRDMGGADLGLHQAVEQGLVRGPRLFFCGKAFSQTGGHGDLRQTGRSPIHATGCACAYHGSLTRVVDGADALRKEIRETLRQGAHHIKLMLSGGVLSPTDPLWMPQYSDAEIRAAVEEACGRHCYVAAHAHTSEAAIRCAELGIRSIEHGTLIDEQAAERIADTDSFVVPTLAIIDALLDDAISSTLSPEARSKVSALMDSALQAIIHCEQAGVPIGFGTDLLGQLHPRQNREFLLRSAVQSPIDILRSATSVNARLLNREGEIGVIAPRAQADLLLIDGDPLQSV